MQEEEKRIQRRDVTIRRYVLYANTMRAVYWFLDRKINERTLTHGQVTGDVTVCMIYQIY